MNANRLGAETSAYLRQHAANPVHWYPWGEAALAAARREDKPILLSIGYAACHWCHVMAAESFADPEVAALMNAHFVNIKLDREERPDLDQIYQAAQQLLTRQPGGWPLTMFLTPELTPFFGGTYFPKEARHGLPAFSDLLLRVAEAWAKQRGDIAETGRAVQRALTEIDQRLTGQQAIDTEMLAAARAEYREAFDPEHGGLGTAPKFPRAPELEFCLYAAPAAGDQALAGSVLRSLEIMAKSGLNDALGGGFFRYCVDARWDIPHFEKMLYDNALLLGLFADAHSLAPNRAFADAAEGIVAWLIREMRSPLGAFYASLDADSEHEEGKYYLWSRDEMRSLLSESAYQVAALHWGLAGSPNFEGRAWHLRQHATPEVLASRLSRPLAEIEEILHDARLALLRERARRVPPGRDEKLLVAWNALAIRGLARAARAFARPEWHALAREILGAIRHGAWSEGRLFATIESGPGRLPAYLDDHAFLLEALLELMEVEFDPGDLAWARELADALLQRFEAETGGFYFTASDHEALLARMRHGYDQATPAGNGVAARALLRLGELLGELPYLTAGRRAVAALLPSAGARVEGHGALLRALQEALLPSTLLLLRGPEAERQAWKAALPAFRPGLLVIDLGATLGLPPPLDRPAVDHATAWVCTEGRCLPPIVSRDELLAVIGGAVPAGGAPQ